MSHPDPYQQPGWGGQPQYGHGDQQSYGYGDQHYGYADQQQYGYADQQYGWNQPPPPRRGVPVWVWAVAAVVAIAAAGVGGYFLFRKGDSGTTTTDAGGTEGRSVTLPASFDDFRRITSFPTDTLKATLGDRLAQFGASSTETVQHAQIGVYGRGGSTTPAVIFISISLDDVPKLKDKVANDGVEAAVEQFVGGANNEVSGGATPQTVSPGSKGGSMRCSAGQLKGSQVGFCGWGDRSVFAITIVVGASSPEAAATTTRDLREAAES